MPWPLRRLSRAWARHGPYALMLFAFRRSFRPLLTTLKFVRETTFDRRHSVVTRGRSDHGGLGQQQDGNPYEGIPPRLFAKILKRLAVEPKEFTFLDIGCGKGKALILAAQRGFSAVIGVEVDTHLALIARDNLSRFAVNGRVDAVDAARMQLPHGQLFVFLANPFGEATLRAVLERLRASLSAQPRRALVVYANPRQHHVFAEFPEFSQIASHGRWPERRWWIAWEAAHPAGPPRQPGD
jgi:SAM-dependent methyltransferase